MIERGLIRTRVSRRVALQSVGIGLGLLAGCSGANDGGATDAGSGDDAAAGSGGQGSEGAAGATQSGAAGAWAIGGTALLASAVYPDPFAAGGESCALTCVLTQGPCWAPSAPLRQDISEGEPGIPMRLILRVLSADGCTPVSGAEVEIWYCNTDGVYSAEDVEGGDFCTGGDEAALAGYFFRGRAISDDAGKVTFDGCFPGWYSGRSVHIHVLVRPADSAGESTTTNAIAISQLFFPEALTQEIFESVAGYLDRGQPDTGFDSDNVLTSVDDITPYVVDYQRQSDGVLLAWKNIVISSTESCGSSGDAPGGGPGGGFPPGGMPPG
jgi:protocatechuate 3,4-dioxygenase beta subunit